SSLINGYSQVDFNNKKKLKVLESETLKPSTISLFVVGKMKSETDTWGAFIGKTDSRDWNGGYGIARNNGNDDVRGFVGTWDRTFVKSPITMDTNNIWTLNFT
ncbi:hypothetical protein, partial [Halomonas marinisediminis]|uniref:hypothetical protein n=1 Tax=Halomonas marinisediminis TaxID=2546095 RepID=UPI001404FF96